MSASARSTILCALLVVVTACGAERPSFSATPLTSAPPPPTATATPEDDDVDVSWVATARVPTIEVFETADGTEPSHIMDNPTAVGGPLVFLVVGDVDATEIPRLEVLLPVRPNGSTGWIDREAVDLSFHQYRIEVTLAQFTIEVFHKGDSVFATTVGVARDNAPTPGGRYYLTELIVPIEDDSPYGPFAYGLSGFSETFESFNGGPGQLGIHGTDDPSSIGTQVSSGCVRLSNDDITTLAGFLPLGTPVEIIT